MITLVGILSSFPARHFRWRRLGNRGRSRPGRRRAARSRTSPSAQFAGAPRPLPILPHWDYSRPAHADAAEPADAVAHLRGADSGLPAVECEPARIWRHVRALLPGRHHRLFRRLSRPRAGDGVAARPVPRSDRRQDHGGRGHRHAGRAPVAGRRDDHRRLASHPRAHHPAARDHRLGPARISREPAGLGPGQRARQVEDDAAARLAGRADPRRRAAAMAVGADWSAWSACGARPR